MPDSRHVCMIIFDWEFCNSTEALLVLVNFHEVMQRASVGRNASCNLTKCQRVALKHGTDLNEMVVRVCSNTV